MRRSYSFWVRGIHGRWPLQVQGHVFLGKAILDVGRALLGEEWDDTIPLRSMLPVLVNGPNKVFVGDGFAAAYALTLIRQHRPQSLSAPDKTMPPLTQAEWQSAFELYASHEARSNLKASEIMRAGVLPSTTAALANGVLAASCRVGNKFDPVPAEAWANEEIAYPRFVECQMNPTAPDRNMYPTLAQAVLDPFPRELLEGNHWIFVTGESLGNFVHQVISPGQVGSSSETARHTSDVATTIELPPLNVPGQRRSARIKAQTFALRLYGKSGPGNELTNQDVINQINLAAKTAGVARLGDSTILRAVKRKK